MIPTEEKCTHKSYTYSHKYFWRRSYFRTTVGDGINWRKDKINENFTLFCNFKKKKFWKYIFLIIFKNSNVKIIKSSTIQSTESQKQLSN